MVERGDHCQRTVLIITQRYTRQVFWFDQLAIAVQQYGGDVVGRKNRLWRFLKNNQGCQTQRKDIHRTHTNDASTTYINIVVLYRDKLNDEGYKSSQKTAYATRKQRPEECPLAYASLVEYLEEEAMPTMIDQHGNKVHRQPIETFTKE